MYDDTTPGFIYVSTNFQLAVTFARNAVIKEAIERRGAMLADVLAIFRMWVPEDRLLADSDERYLDEHLPSRAKCPFWRSKDCFRVQGEVPLWGAEFAMVNARHDKGKSPKFSEDMIAWYPLPLMGSGPLFL